MTDFARMINSLNGKSLQHVLCTYSGVETDEGPGVLEEEVLEAIACSFNDIDTGLMLEIIAANWGRPCKLEIVDDSYSASVQWPVVRVTFDGFALNDISFELDWVDE